MCLQGNRAYLEMAIWVTSGKIRPTHLHVTPLRQHWFFPSAIRDSATPWRPDLLKLRSLGSLLSDCSIQGQWTHPNVAIAKGRNRGKAPFPPFGSASLNCWAVRRRSALSNRRWLRSASCLSLRDLLSSCACLLSSTSAASGHRFRDLAWSNFFSSCLTTWVGAGESASSITSIWSCWFFGSNGFLNAGSSPAWITRAVPANLTHIPSSIVLRGDWTCDESS